MLGELCALAAAMSWSMSVILFKRSEAVSPQAMNLFKNSVAALLLIATLPILGVSIDWERSQRDWMDLALSGILGIAIADTLILMALRRLGAGLLAIVDCAYAPTIIGFSVLFLGEAVGWAFGGGAVLVVGGVLLASSEKRRPAEPAPEAGEPESAEPETADEGGRTAGIAMGVAGIVAMAAGVILAKPVLERGHLVEVTLVRLVAGIVAQLAWTLFVPGRHRDLGVFRPGPVWRTLLPGSILGTYVAMLFWLGGFKWAPASVAAVLNQMASVFTLVLARVFLGEVLTGRRVVGAGAAIGGAILILSLGSA